MSSNNGGVMRMPSRMYLAALMSALTNLAFTVIIGLSGCASTTPKEPEAKELVAASSKATDAPEQELLNEAQRHFASGLYTVARESFERLRDSYPSGSYREFAEIKIADCYFESGSYDDASRRYEEFFRNYPASSSVTYAIFKAARSHQLAFRGVGRDPSPLERSLEIYNNLLNNYPETSLTAAAKSYRSEVQQLLAEGEKNVSDFYSTAGKEDAAEIRMQQFERKQRELAKLQPKLTEKPESSSSQNGDISEKVGDNARDESISQSDGKNISPPQVVSAQITDQGQANRAEPTLINSGSAGSGVELRGGEDAGNTMIMNRLRQGSKGGPAQVSTEADNDSSPAPLRITNLDCKESGERSVVFSLSRAIPNAEALNQSFAAKKRILEVTLPVEEATPATRSCFGDRDLVISENGKVVIRGPSGADLMSISNPPRLVLVLRYPPSRPRFAN